MECGGRHGACGAAQRGVRGVGVPGPQVVLRSVATLPTYNVHFMHDVEAFQFGIARALLATLAREDKR